MNLNAFMKLALRVDSFHNATLLPCRTTPVSPCLPSGTAVHHPPGAAMPSPLTISEFVARWAKAELSERGGAQSHYLDLCQVLGQPAPAAADPSGKIYAFEMGASKAKGGQGFADVCWRGRFAWEYKRKGMNLEEAYRQLLQYREDLDNPPLLVVCDLQRFQVHTNFTGTAKRVYGTCQHL